MLVLVHLFVRIHVHFTVCVFTEEEQVCVYTEMTVVRDLLLGNMNVSGELLKTLCVHMCLCVHLSVFVFTGCLSGLQQCRF